MPYELRYFFDPGSGVCLWAKNDAARERFGYAIDLSDLPITQSARAQMQRLVSWFDRSMNWKAPLDASPDWSTNESHRFLDEAKLGLELLRAELPTDEYILIDEAKI